VNERDDTLPHTAELRDGSEIVIRAIRPEDKQAIADGFERLSPESRYRRFFAPIQELSARDLRYLTEVDHRDHEALIAFERPTGVPVGAARYVRSDDPAEAEVAVTVVDDWQGRGVATVMLDRLVERAREEDVERFVAIVMSENTDALEMFSNLAPGAEKPRRSASGNLELVFDLPAPGQVSESLLGRALHAAARGALNANPWPVIRDRIAR
jgi:RimJ/RimL family protein N-acetyltransferase